MVHQAISDDMNPTIRQARQVALEALKPSDAQLARGLALHADSVVVESYGFLPRASIDGEAMARAFEAGASEIELKDLGEWTAIERIVTVPALTEEFKAAWAHAGVTAIFVNAGEEYAQAHIVLKRLAHHTFVADHLRDFCPKAVTAEDIVAAKQAGRHSLVFTCNAVPLMQQWVSPPEEVRYIRYFHQLGARMTVSYTHLTLPTN